MWKQTFMIGRLTHTHTRTRTRTHTRTFEKKMFTYKFGHQKNKNMFTFNFKDLAPIHAQIIYDKRYKNQDPPPFPFEDIGVDIIAKYLPLGEHVENKTPPPRRRRRYCRIVPNQIQ